MLGFPALLIGIGAVFLNTYSNFVMGVIATGTSNSLEQRVENTPKSVAQQPEIQPKAEVRTAVAKSDLSQVTQRPYQPPSEIYLAKQECNSLIAAALGNQDPRLLRDRDKTCAKYKILKENTQ